MVLYCFLTHQKAKQTATKRISKMMEQVKIEDYIIVVGGEPSHNSYDDTTKLLRLKCNDFYEGLPEKVCKLFRYLSENDQFRKYSHFCKCDEDIIIAKGINITKIQKMDYGGIITRPNIGQDKDIDRGWHIGRCSQNSWFNKNPYEGKVVPYCGGGYAYIVSSKVCNLIAVHGKDFDTEIYEDLYIAKLLAKQHIYPKSINSAMYKTIISPVHLMSHPIIQMWKNFRYRIKNLLMRVKILSISAK